MRACAIQDCQCAALHSAAVAGDTQAENRLLESLKPLVARTVRGIFQGKAVGSEDWKDIAQEVFINVHRYLATWREECNFCHWVESIARRRAITHLRRSNNVARTGLPELQIDHTVVDKCPQPSPAQRECIDRVYKSLSESARQIYDLAAERRGKKEIASILGIGERTVYWNLNRIRLQLQPCWDR